MQVMQLDKPYPGLELHLLELSIFKYQHRILTNTPLVKNDFILSIRIIFGLSKTPQREESRCIMSIPIMKPYEL